MFGKMPFDDVDFVNDALFSAFHPNGLQEGEDIDPRLDALFTIFLEFAHWSKEEYWTEVDAKHDEECENCKAEKAAEDKKSGAN